LAAGGFFVFPSGGLFIWMDQLVIWGDYCLVMANAVSFIQPLNNDTEQRLLTKATAILFTGLGLAGVDQISDTSAHTGNWNIFHAVSDCVISAISYFPGSQTGTLAGQTLKAGDRIYGRILGLTLTSGTGELYRSAIG
jgi:hypothetical protein